MKILTGREEAVKLVTHYEVAFIGILTDSKKGSSTKSIPPRDYYTLEFEKYDQIRGRPIDQEEPLFHYMQIGSGGQVTDPKTKKLVPIPDPKKPKVNQLYLALSDEPKQIAQLVEITEDDIDSLREAVAEKKVIKE
ncbi:unnamed protein product [Adineta steineri]|uniref:Uncharacterized protein n=1 Tax=Adineta steineri TaxID=433720 RepID=A0A818HMU1_9BILA|nr:unnamed protein product [Adineta steineri]CAF1286559.1 unnamed protein product [Adineta steineri]CAF3511197.1 unnamed protein product [Adineta steineri]CAF3692229.1 unnamed protein product [Adineta steineri]